MAIDARDDFRGQMMFAQSIGQNIGMAIGAYRKQKAEQGVVGVLSNPDYDEQTRYEKLQEIKGWADTKAGAKYQEMQQRLIQQREEDMRVRTSAISYLSQDGTDAAMFEGVPTEALRQVSTRKFAESYMQPSEEDILNLRSKRLDIQGKRLRNEGLRQDMQSGGQDVMKNYNTAQSTLSNLYKLRQDADKDIWEDENAKAAHIRRLQTQIQNWEEISNAMLPSVRQQFGMGGSAEGGQNIPDYVKKWNEVEAAIKGENRAETSEGAAEKEETNEGAAEKEENNEEYIKRLKEEAVKTFISFNPEMERKQNEQINEQIRAAARKKGISDETVDKVLNAKPQEKPLDVNKNLYLGINELSPADIDKAYEIYMNRLIVKDAAISIEEFVKKAEKDPEFLWQYLKRRNPNSRIKESYRKQGELETQGGMPW